MTLSPYNLHGEGRESAFTVTPPKIKFGPGSLHEVGYDAKAHVMSRVVLYTDKKVAGWSQSQSQRPLCQPWTLTS
jgi:hypothetical protein